MRSRGAGMWIDEKGELWCSECLCVLALALLLVPGREGPVATEGDALPPLNVPTSLLTLHGQLGRT